MSITSNIANVASRLTTGDVVSNLNADLLDGQSGSYYTGISSSGFDQANTAATIAQAAFVQANTATIQAQSAFSQANTGTTQAEAAFSQANNVYTQANTATIQAQAAFSQANTGSTVAFASFNQANNAYAQANTGTTQAEAAFSQANNAYAQANTGTTQAEAAFSTANGAYSTANTKFPSTGGTISGDVRIGGSLQIDANLVVSGNVTTINANNLSIVDNMIYLNHDANVANPDIGIAAAYNDGTYHHTGFFRDATDGVWKIFDNYKPEPDASIYIDTSNSTFRIASFQANNITANSIILGTDFKLPVGNTAQRPSASAGKLYYNNETGKFEGYGTVWGSIGGGALISDTAPANPASGDLWWNSSDGKTYIYYGNVWVQAQPGGEGQYLPLTGGTVTGSITGTGNFTANNIIASNNITYSGTLTGVTGTYSRTVTANNIVSSNNVTYSGTLTGGTGIVNIGSGQIYKDANGNFGINTTSPTAKLDVVGGAGLPMRVSHPGNISYGTAIQVKTTGGTDDPVISLNNYNGGSPVRYGISCTDNGSMAFLSGAYESSFGTERMRLDASGNLGVGVTPTNATLDVVGNVNSVAIAARGRSADNLSGIAFRSNNAATEYAYIQGGPTYLALGVNGSESARIDSSGNLGIGTNSPAYKLDVTGTLRGTTSLIAGSSTTNVTINSGAVNFNGANVAFGINKTAPSVSNTSRFDCSVGALSSRLGGGFWNGWHWATQDVLTNSSSSNCFPRVGQYWAYGTTANPSDLVFNYYASNLGGIIGNLNFGTENAGYVAFGTNSAERLRIDGSGLVGIGTTSPGYALEVHKQILIKGNDSSGNEYQDWPNCSFNIRRSDNFVSNGITMASFGYRSDPIYLTDSAVCNIRIWDSTQAASATTSASTTKMTIGSPGSFSILTGNSADRFVIDSSGRITMPAQPAFITVAVAAGATYTAGVKINYSVNTLNRGSCWNGTNNYFVAPVAGVYLFKAQLWTNTGAAGNAWFYVNGTNRYGSFGNEAANIGYNGYCLTEIFNLAANDTVQVYCRSGTVYTDGSFSTFSGFLIG